MCICTYTMPKMAEYKNHCCAANTAFYDTYITITYYIGTTTYDNAVI